MTPDDIRDYIIAGLADWDTSNVFIGNIPDGIGAPDSACGVYEYGGTPSYVMGGGSYVLETVRVQIRVRGTDYAVVRGQCEDIRKLLDVVGSETLGSTRYLRITASDLPIELPPDPQDRYNMVFNLSAMKEPS